MDNAKNEYYREYYRKNTKRQAHANYDYWLKKAKDKYKVENPTEEQIKETRNEYYRNYRKTRPAVIAKNQNDFFERYAENKDTLLD